VCGCDCAGKSFLSFCYGDCESRLVRSVESGAVWRRCASVCRRTEFIASSAAKTQQFVGTAGLAVIKACHRDPSEMYCQAVAAVISVFTLYSTTAALTGNLKRIRRL